MEIKCTHKGCVNKLDRGGYCSTHYSQFRRHGETWRVGARKNGCKPGPTRYCGVKGCGRIHTAKNLCAAHYNAWRVGITAETEEERCNFPGCTIKKFAKELCHTHYYAFYNKIKNDELQLIVDKDGR